MKKFTKLFLSCAAIAALTSTVAVSAMAEKIDFDMKGDVTIKATYDTEECKLEFAVPSDMDTAKAATFVALPSGAELTDEKIVGIDQTASGVNFENAGLKGKPQAPAEGAENPVTYTVKLGYFNTDGQFKILEGTLFSAGVMVGDASQDGDIMINDAVLIVDHLNGKELTGDALKAADASGDGEVMINDAVFVVDYLNGKTDNGVGVVK